MANLLPLVGVWMMAMVPFSKAYDFYVGGKDGWVQSPSESYSSWAGRNRFQINNRLVFKYKKGDDSVLVVKKEAFDSCNTTDPIKRLDGDGESVFVFDRSGPFFFISGSPGRCEKGQKIIVVVLAVRHKKGIPPAISAPSSSPIPPSSSPVSSPSSAPITSPSPSSSHVPSHSPISPPISSPYSPISTPPSSSVTPPSYSPIYSPASSPHAPSPFYTPISSPSPAPSYHVSTPSPSPSHTPTSAPSPSPKPSTRAHAPSPAAVQEPPSQPPTSGTPPPSSEAGSETGFAPAPSPNSVSPASSISGVSAVVMALLLSGAFIV